MTYLFILQIIENKYCHEQHIGTIEEYIISLSTFDINDTGKIMDTYNCYVDFAWFPLSTYLFSRTGYKTSQRVRWLLSLLYAFINKKKQMSLYVYIYININIIILRWASGFILRFFSTAYSKYV